MIPPLNTRARFHTALHIETRFVAPKSETQQASAAVFRARDLLVRQRTQIINAIRGHLAEFGIVAPKSPAHMKTLLHALEKLSVAPQCVAPLQCLEATLTALEQQIATLDAEIAARRAR